MRKALIAVGVLAVAYYLYKMYNKDDKKELDPPQKTGDAVALALEQAKNSKPQPIRKTIIDDNRNVFRSMKGVFNAEESSTVAPSINAKIGIF
jgi:hypothetical protein